MKKIYLFLIFLTGIFLTGGLYAKTVIFDVGGVLLKKSSFKAATEVIGLKPFIKFFFKQPAKISQVEDILFQELLRLPATPKAHEIYVNNPSYDDTGKRKLPPVLLDWLMGNIDAYQITNDLKSLESSRDVKKVVSKMSKTFLPENLASIMCADCSMFSLARACKEAGHKVIILSNFDPITLRAYIKAHSAMFSCFDDIIISGEIGMIKPCYEIYQYVLQKVGVLPQDCILIDDQITNVDSARTCGFSAIQHKNFKRTRQALNSFGII